MLVLLRAVPYISEIAINEIFSVILDIRTTLSTEDYGAKNIAAELITFLVKPAHSIQSTVCQSESGLSKAIRDKLEQFVNSHLGFYADETFQVLTALSSVDKKLVIRMVPKIVDAVQEVEKKRGIQGAGGGMFQRRLSELKRRLQY